MKTCNLIVYESGQVSQSRRLRKAVERLEYGAVREYNIIVGGSAVRDPGHPTCVGGAKGRSEVRVNENDNGGFVIDKHDSIWFISGDIIMSIAAISEVSRFWIVHCPQYESVLQLAKEPRRKC